MPKYLGKIIWTVVILGAAGGGYYWWDHQKNTAKPIEYRTAAVNRGDLVQSVTANGQLNPGITVQVGSQVSGLVQKLHADWNSTVTNGQMVAELDPATYEARLIQAQGDLMSAKAQLALAALNAKRAGELAANKLIPQSEFEQTTAELQQREATVKIREAALKSAEVDLARTKIYSPIDGTVISRNVDIGQTVQASFTAPTLFNIANDLAKMEIAAMVSEADIGGVAEGQDVTFTVEAFPGRNFRGKISQVRNLPTTNQNVVNYATIVQVRNDDLKLKPGMTANVAITTAKKEKSLRVPNAALRFRPPQGANVKSNVVLLAGSSTNSAAAAVPDDGIPSMGGFTMPPEMRQRILQRHDKDGDGRLNEAEQKAYLEERKARMAQRAAGGGGGFGGGGGGGGGFGGSEGGGPGGGFASRPRESTSPIRTLYLVSTNSAASDSITLQPVQVRLGISDGAFTEVIEGLKEGDVVATGSTGGEVTAAVQPTARSPFGGPFGGGGGRR